MNIFTKSKLCFILSLAFFIATPVLSAEIILESEKPSSSTGEEFLVSVSLNTENEPLNAVEGKVIFPADLLIIKEIRSGNSAVNFWIEQPRSTQAGEILFSGITPGGLVRPKEFLFSIVFRGEKEGQGAILLAGLRILKNDGIGSSAVAKTTPYQFSISSGVSTTAKEIKPITDLEPPEDFKPMITKDPNIFDGKSFLIFATQDKGSGVASYKIREGRLGWYKTVESPYLLKYQALNKKIFVKAVDNSGNERVAVLYPQVITWQNKLLEIFGIILVIVFLVFFLKRK